MRLRVRYSGRVQGVGFRAAARSVSGGFVVSGWVRNETDATVLLEVQGEAAVVEAYLAALREEMGRNIKREDRAGVAEEVGENGFVIRR